MAYKTVKRSKLLRRGFLLPLLVLLIALGIVLDVAVHHHNSQSNQPGATKNVKTPNTIDYSPATSGDNSSNEDRKTSGSPSSTLSGGNSSSSAFSASMTANNNNGNVHVGTVVNGTSSGDCVLTASQTGQQTMQLGSSKVSNEGTYYWCGVFNIPTSQFPNSGTWNLTLTVTSNGTTATAHASVTI